MDYYHQIPKASLGYDVVIASLHRLESYLSSNFSYFIETSYNCSK